MFPQYGELRPTSGRDLLASLGHPSTFQLVSRLGSITARHSRSGLQPNSAAPPIFGRTAITLGIGPHSSLVYKSRNLFTTFNVVRMTFGGSF